MQEQSRRHKVKTKKRRTRKKTKTFFATMGWLCVVMSAGLLVAGLFIPWEAQDTTKWYLFISGLMATGLLFLVLRSLLRAR